MCGILAYISPLKPIREDEFLRLLHGIKHRGPDDCWHWISDSMAVGQTRLSIFDTKDQLTSFNPIEQPVIVLFNGEIWNFNDLAGKFDSLLITSEYELIRQGYLASGINFISRIDGVFFIAIIDRSTNNAFFVRDPMGVKPGFYHHSSEKLIFTASSDIKTISGLSEYFPFLNIDYLQNNSIFHFSDYKHNILEGVRQIPPQHYVRVDFGRQNELEIKTVRFESKFLIGSFARPPSIENQLEILEQAVLKRYNHAEVYPVGLLLSGGIDSSLLAFVSKRLGIEAIVCFYLGSPNSDDYLWARTVSKKTGYRLRHIQPKASDIIRLLPKYCFDLSGNTGFVAPYLSYHIKLMYPQMKVLLCGEGADELYGGYTCYSDPLYYLSCLVKRIERSIWPTALIDKAKAMAENAENLKDAASRVFKFYLEEQLVNSHLVPLDHGFMANSLELRLPFLDLMNVKFARDLPLTKKVSNTCQKKILKDLLAQVFGMRDDKFLNRKKIGFPSAIPPGIVNLDNYAEARIPTWWAEMHPYRPLFRSFFEMLWFDLSSLIFARNSETSPGELDMAAIYSTGNLADLKACWGKHRV
jgi:asparagine synthase (glutamine-hydrolysing)